jgi:hypothetical protein
MINQTMRAMEAFVPTARLKGMIMVIVSVTTLTHRALPLPLPLRWVCLAAEWQQTSGHCSCHLGPAIALPHFWVHPPRHLCRARAALAA